MIAYFFGSQQWLSVFEIDPQMTPGDPQLHQVTLSLLRRSSIRTSVTPLCVSLCSSMQVFLLSGSGLLKATQGNRKRHCSAVSCLAHRSLFSLRHIACCLVVLSAGAAFKLAPREQQNVFEIEIPSCRKHFWKALSKAIPKHTVLVPSGWNVTWASSCFFSLIWSFGTWSAVLCLVFFFQWTDNNAFSFFFGQSIKSGLGSKNFGIQPPVTGFCRVCTSKPCRSCFSCCCCDSVFIQTLVDYITFMCAMFQVDAATVHWTNQPCSLSTGWTSCCWALEFLVPKSENKRDFLVGWGAAPLSEDSWKPSISIKESQWEKHVLEQIQTKLVTLELALHTSQCLSDLTLLPLPPPPSVCCLQRTIDAKSSTLLLGNRPPSVQTWIG